MKKLALLFVLVVAFACRQGDVVKEPAHLMSEDDMVNALYDISVFQAMRGSAGKELEENKVDPKAYIYKKYNIDSTTFSQNHRYYASRLEQYEEIQKKVKEKLLAEKTKLNPPKVAKSQDLSKDKIKK